MLALCRDDSTKPIGQPGMTCAYMQQQSITIVVSDAEGKREGSEHVLEDSDWDCVDNYETPSHRMDLRTRRVVQGGYRGVIPDLED